MHLPQLGINTGADAITVLVGPDTFKCVGFDHLDPGPHPLRLTLQGDGGQIKVSYSDSLLWLCDHSTQERATHEWHVNPDVLAGDPYGACITGQIVGTEQTHPDGFSVWVSQLDLDVETQEPGEDERELTPGITMRVTNPGPSLPDAFDGEGQGGRALSLSLVSADSGSLVFETDGSGAAVYGQTSDGWQKITGPIRRTSGGELEGGYTGFRVHTCDEFTSAVTITARFVHDTSDLDAADKVKIKPPQCSSDGGGIHDGTILRDREWAHANRINPAHSQTIRVEPSGWKDYDEVEGELDMETNRWDANATEYKAIGTGGANPGECRPARGPFTEWYPAENGAGFQVEVTLHDEEGPTDDCPKSVHQVVNAFEVKVQMQVIDNADGGHGTETRELWEYETPDFFQDRVHWANLPCSASTSHWEYDESNDNPPPSDSDNVHVDYTYVAVPGAADLNGGMIEADLLTRTSLVMDTNVEDVDSYDGTLAVSLGVGFGNPVGISIGVEVETDEDCCEGIAVATWGYTSTDGLGATSDPQSNKHVHKSSEHDDPNDRSSLCWFLSAPVPTSWKENHFRQSRGNYEARSLIARAKDHVIQAEWTGFVNASTYGTASGKTAEATINDWWVEAYMVSVRFAP